MKGWCTAPPGGTPRPQILLKVAEGYLREVHSLELAMPPGAGCASLGEVREVVVVNNGAHVVGRRRRERIALEQCQHFRGPFEQAGHEVHEPGILLEAIQRREPHLPVKPRLMRGDPGWRALYVPRLVLELVVLPGDAVIRALDDDLEPRRGHHGK